MLHKYELYWIQESFTTFITLVKDEMQLIIGSKRIKRDPYFFHRCLCTFHCLNRIVKEVRLCDLTEAIIEYILRKGTNFTKLWLLNDYLHIYKEGERKCAVGFRKFAYCFDWDIKDSLIFLADRMLEINKRIHGETNMKKYLNFYHAKYCTELTEKEKMFLKRKRKNIIGSLYENIFL